jgi:imidazole glycerol-phosphate synthase subunit HisH
MRVTIFDYGAGNLHSLRTALVAAGAQVTIATDPVLAVDTHALVLPGVGAFSHATSRLAPGREAMRDAIIAGLPTIGICLGMQLLFDRSDEGPGTGLGVIAGDVERLRARRAPQIGWNTLDDVVDPLLAGAGAMSVYYANGFVCRPRSPAVVTAWSTHETDRFPAIVRAHRAIGVQFHPEKSSRRGVQFLRDALDECSR